MEFWSAPDETGGVTSLPGIYRFIIDESWTYIGRFTHASRPLEEYVKNVKKLMEGRPYRPQNPEGFRAVHKALFWAVTEQRSITLEIVENARTEELNERERYWISKVPPEWLLNGRRTFP